MRQIPFKPSIAVDPKTAETDSPSGAGGRGGRPHQNQKPGLDQETSHLRTAKVALPPGMGLNPSAANGLQACTDAQFGKGDEESGRPARPHRKSARSRSTRRRCPKGRSTGNVYLGQQLSRDPASGQEYRIFVDAESARYGISVRLIGNVSADPQTGQLTTTFAENPQVPFSSFQPPVRRRAEGAPDQPADLRSEHDHVADDPMVDAVGSVPPGEEGGPRRRQPNPETASP